MEQRDQLLHLSQRLPDLWQSSHLRHAQRKALLRSLIARVIGQADGPRIALKSRSSG